MAEGHHSEFPCNDARVSHVGAYSAWLRKIKSDEAKAKWLSNSTTRYFTIDFDAQIFFYSHSEGQKRKISNPVRFTEILGAERLPPPVRATRKGKNNQSCGFLVKTLERTFELYTTNHVDAAQWTHAVNAAVEIAEKRNNTAQGTKECEVINAPAEARWAAGDEPWRPRPARLGSKEPLVSCNNAPTMEPQQACLPEARDAVSRDALWQEQAPLLTAPWVHGTEEDNTASSMRQEPAEQLDPFACLDAFGEELVAATGLEANTAEQAEALVMDLQRLEAQQKAAHAVAAALPKVLQASSSEGRVTQESACKQMDQKPTDEAVATQTFAESPGPAPAQPGSSSSTVDYNAKKLPPQPEAAGAAPCPLPAPTPKTVAETALEEVTAPCPPPSPVPQQASETVATAVATPCPLPPPVQEAVKSTADVDVAPCPPPPPPPVALQASKSTPKTKDAPAPPVVSQAPRSALEVQDAPPPPPVASQAASRSTPEAEDAPCPPLLGPQGSTPVAEAAAASSSTSVPQAAAAPCPPPPQPFQALQQETAADGERGSAKESKKEKKSSKSSKSKSSKRDIAHGGDASASSSDRAEDCEKPKPMPPAFGDAANSDWDEPQGTQTDLIRCEDCLRSFNKESIEKHRRVCKKVFQQKAKKFNSAEKRLAEFVSTGEMMSAADKVEKVPEVPDGPVKASDYAPASGFDSDDGQQQPLKEKKEVRDPARAPKGGMALEFDMSDNPRAAAPAALEARLSKKKKKQKTFTCQDKTVPSARAAGSKDSDWDDRDPKSSEGERKAKQPTGADACGAPQLKVERHVKVEKSQKIFKTGDEGGGDLGDLLSEVMATDTAASSSAGTGELVPGFHCIGCDFQVLRINDAVWKDEVPYMTLRNAYPDALKLRSQLRPQDGACAYCCQCSSRSADAAASLTDVASDLRWRVVSA